MPEKTFKVMMLAFETEVGQPVKIREVTVPDAPDDKDKLLGAIFYWGQNDFQPQRICSVSVGDVIMLDGEFHMVRGCGFKQVTAAELEEYCKMDRRDRTLFALPD